MDDDKTVAVREVRVIPTMPPGRERLLVVVAGTV
jgi:hypothetical protein